MHIVGLRYENATGALSAGALKPGAVVNFRHKYINAEHPDAYVAYCSRYKIGFMPRIGTRLLEAAGYTSPIRSKIRSVSGSGKYLEVVVDLNSPFQTAPTACSLTRPTTTDSGIYAILNTQSWKAYIGSTKNFETRRYQHLTLLQTGHHFSPNLQRDWSTNPSAFAFVIVDISPSDPAALERHRIFISKTENPEFGFNQGGGFSPTTTPRRSSSNGQPNSPAPLPTQIPHSQKPSAQPSQTEDTLGCFVLAAIIAGIAWLLSL